jgi:hypothetical protein
VAVEVYDREGDADVFHLYTRHHLTALEAARTSWAPTSAGCRSTPAVRRARLTLAFRTEAALPSGRRIGRTRLEGAR